MKKIPWIIIIFLILIGVALATTEYDMQPLYITHNESFTDIHVVVDCWNVSVCNDIHNQWDLSASTRDEAVFYLTDTENSSYDMTYRYHVAVNISGTMEWILNDTFGYFGRANNFTRDTYVVGDFVVDKNATVLSNLGVGQAAHPSHRLIVEGQWGDIAKFSTTGGIGSEVVIDSSGNVAIGDTTPAEKLEVTGNSDFI